MTTRELLKDLLCLANQRRGIGVWQSRWRERLLHSAKVRNLEINDHLCICSLRDSRAVLLRSFVDLCYPDTESLVKVKVVHYKLTNIARSEVVGTDEIILSQQRLAPLTSDELDFHNNFVGSTDSFDFIYGGEPTGRSVWHWSPRQRENVCIHLPVARQKRNYGLHRNANSRRGDGCHFLDQVTADTDILLSCAVPPQR